MKTKCRAPVLEGRRGKVSKRGWTEGQGEGEDRLATSVPNASATWPFMPRGFSRLSSSLKTPAVERGQDCKLVDGKQAIYAGDSQRKYWFNSVVLDMHWMAEFMKHVFPLKD